VSKYFLIGLIPGNKKESADNIISGNRNVSKKENKNILKYVDHAIYTQPILMSKPKLYP